MIYHKEMKEVEMEMEVIEGHGGALQRQVAETIEIEYSEKDILMNSKGDYMGGEYHE